eukprot:5281611-Lingulodinium_polyedra.AAC.1
MHRGGEQKPYANARSNANAFSTTAQPNARYDLFSREMHELKCAAQMAFGTLFVLLECCSVE